MKTTASFANLTSPFMSDKTKKILLWLGCGLTALFVVMMVLGGLFIISLRSSWSQDFSREKFDRAVWVSMTGSEDADNPRGPMTQDLMTHHLKSGMGREEIAVLLGEPDYDTYPEATDSSPPNVMRYYLGFWSGMHMDPDSLDLHLDEGDKFVEAEIVQH